MSQKLISETQRDRRPTAYCHRREGLMQAEKLWFGGQEIMPSEKQCIVVAATSTISQISEIHHHVMCPEVVPIIRERISDTNYVVVVENDLAVLDYLSDFICCLYGVPGVYGVVTLPSGVREGINMFLDGFIRTENTRFRESKLSSKTSEQQEEIKRTGNIKYPAMAKQLGGFKLHVMGQLINRNVNELSGGELQRTSLAPCIGKTASLYLIDEPSAYLDSEQRLHAAKVIKRFIIHAKKTAFVIDFIMATYLADRVIVSEGQPSVDTVACKPQSLLEGMNRFMKMLDIFFRLQAPSPDTNYCLENRFSRRLPIEREWKKIGKGKIQSR